MSGARRRIGKVEWYEFDAEPGAALVSDPHGPGTVEHSTVLDGTLEVASGGESAEAAGSTARYRADANHAIRNTGAGVAKALLVVVLQAPPRG